jgi:hypothetical protein
MKVIKSSYNPKLKIPKFKVDAPITDYLEDKGEFFRDVMNRFNSFAIVGKAGSGKTSFVTGMLTTRGSNKVWRQAFNHIVLVMPPSSRASMKDIDFNELLPQDQIYDDLENLDEIYEKIAGWTEEEESTLLIIDDQQAYFRDVKKGIPKMLTHMMNNRRHLRLTTVFLVQNLLSMIPKVMRRSLTEIVLFNGLSKSELEGIYNEYFPSSDKEEYVELLKIIKKPHSWLCIHTNHGGRIYDMDYNRILLKDDEEENN